MKRWMWFVAAALVTAGTVAATSTVQANQGHEEKENETPVSLDKIPKAARDALLREAGGAPIIDVVQETKDGIVVRGFPMLSYTDPRLHWSEDDQDHICARGQSLFCIYRRPKDM